MSPVTAAILVVLGLLPSFVWMFFFYHQDCHPEPKSLIAKTFLMGIIISPVAVILQMGFSKIGSFGPLDYFVADGSLFFLWAAFVEEFIKYYAVRVIALTDPAFDEPVDAMIYMMMAGLGFAAIENILVLFRVIQTLSTSSSGGMEGLNMAFNTVVLTTLGLRSIGATILHALSSGIVGYFLALSWFFQNHRKKLLIVGLLIATLFHFTFNIFLAAPVDTFYDQTRILLISDGLLCVMAFLVFLLFDKIKKRSPRIIPHLSAAAEKEISIT